jgi:hypothetical protein
MTGPRGQRNIAQSPEPTPLVIHRSSGGPTNVLADFVRNNVLPLSTLPVRLSRGVTRAFWIVLAVNVAVLGWLLAVRAGAATCSGLVCSVVTLGDRPLLVLLLSMSCVAALAMAAPMTRGLSSTNGPQLAVIVGAAACGVTALLGLAAVAIAAAVCLAAAFGVFVIVVDRL